MMIQVQIAFLGSDSRTLHQENGEVRKGNETSEWRVIEHVTTLGCLSRIPQENTGNQFKEFVSAAPKVITRLFIHKFTLALA